MKKGSARSLVNVVLVLTLLMVGWFYATSKKKAEPSIDYARSLQGVYLIDTPSSDKENSGSKISSSLGSFRSSLTSSLPKISPEDTDNFSALNRAEIIENIQQAHPSLADKIKEVSNLLADDFIDQHTYYSLLNADSSTLENMLDMYTGSNEEPVLERELTENEKRQLDPYNRLIENPEILLDSIERNESPTASRDPNNPYAVMVQ
jgi:hypothetical protein